MKKTKKENKKVNLLPKCFCGWFKKKNSVAVVRLHGVISSQNDFRKASINLENVKSDLDKAFSVSNLKAVAIAVNSPGGSPVQSELIYKYIRGLSEKKKVPVYTFAEDVAASGGYWLLCAGDAMYASTSSIVGSIGVISAGFGFVGAIKKLGIERRVLTQGESKSVYDSFAPVKDADKKVILGVQSDIHDAFKSIVSSRRGKKIKIPKNKLFSGEFWSGKKGHEIGLVDEIGDLYSAMKDKFGDDILFQHVKKQESWLKKKFGMFASYEGIVDYLFEKIESKISFNKYGL
ncbi:MAG: S49 family peptidase [Alphaproteobacteria bacterium]|nr:S49 family peptidase [Alphaproteobacteria bacterium]